MVAVPEVVVQRRLTLADYEALPDDAGYEIIDGVLFVAPRARPRHQVVANRFAYVLTVQVESTDQGTVVPDADLIVDDQNTYVAPDIMYFAGDRFADVGDDQMIRVVPDLIVEVLSPYNELHDLVTKRRLYAELGVPHYWIVDARANTVRECVLSPNGAYVDRTVSHDEPFQPALFPGLSIDLRRAFA